MLCFVKSNEMIKNLTTNQGAVSSNLAGRTTYIKGFQIFA